MRLLGLILVLLCSALTGALIRSQMKKRIFFLNKLLLLIDFIQTQISFVNTDVFSLLTSLSESTNLSELSFIKECLSMIKNGNEFDCAWNKSVNECALPLKKEDKALLISFGEQLGKSDLSGQISNCELHKQRFQNVIKDAEEGYKKYGNMIFKLGILSGIMIVIVLL